MELLFTPSHQVTERLKLFVNVFVKNPFRDISLLCFLAKYYKTYQEIGNRHVL